MFCFIDSLTCCQTFVYGYGLDSLVCCQTPLFSARVGAAVGLISFVGRRVWSTFLVS
jgi:hypothetical protein